MNVSAFLVLAQTLGAQTQVPVLEFPEAGVDDPAAYDGYATRVFRDSHGNAFQVYVNARDGRVVHVWADAANESAAFTIRDADGQPLNAEWGGAGASATADGDRRVMHHRLAVAAPEMEIGWFLLGTMRQERDFQYQEWHRRPFGGQPFVLDEFNELTRSLASLPDTVRADHLALLRASRVEDVRARLAPSFTLTHRDGRWNARVEHTSLDGRNHLTLELRGDAQRTTASFSNDRLEVRDVSGRDLEIDVTVATDAAPLTPLGRDRLFNVAFEEYVAQQQRVADSLSNGRSPADASADPRRIAFRRLERQIAGLDLLSYNEKLIASMPNYATYFGRDQMMSALMLEPISSADLQEQVISSVLGKIAPSGNVSHEEALGEQAIRENAAEYSALIREWRRGGHLDRARALLTDLQRVRENYRMADDDFQLPVLVDRYLSRTDVPPERKRRFLTASTGSNATRLEALARNVAFVTQHARPFAEDPIPENLVEFYHRDDEGWLPGSWRDSRAGYGNGRYAMDINVIWVPQALQAIERIRQALEALDVPAEEVASAVDVSEGRPSYLRDASGLRAAITAWSDARRYFEVAVDPAAIRSSVSSTLQLMPESERRYWQGRLDESDAAARPLAFLALALDSIAQPIPVANTDPATELLLVPFTEHVLRGETAPSAVLRTLDLFARPYPVGVFVDSLGPVVANDAYASAAVQRRFREDLYHSPRVVWGREVNLLLLGLTKQIEAAYDATGGLRSDRQDVLDYVRALRRILESTNAAVEASGLSHNELWTYRIDGDSLRAVRYGASSDIQLWNVTDLSVRFLMDQLPPPSSR